MNSRNRLHRYYNAVEAILYLGCANFWLNIELYSIAHGIKKFTISIQCMLLASMEMKVMHAVFGPTSSELTITLSEINMFNLTMLGLETSV